MQELTRCEVGVLWHSVNGRKREEIAAHLSNSVNTIKSHLKSIYGKLDIHDRVLLTSWYYQHKTAFDQLYGDMYPSPTLTTGSSNDKDHPKG